jgi:hypothetical protein
LPARARWSVDRCARDSASFGFFSLDAVAAMAVGVDADKAVDTLGACLIKRQLSGGFHEWRWFVERGTTKNRSEISNRPDRRD